MPCCTYLTGNEYTAPTSDTELNEVLAEVRLLTGKDYRVHEIINESRRWWRKPKVYKSYSLLCAIGAPEFQIINFYRPDSDWSINTCNSAGLVVAYLYGVLAGAKQ